MPPYRASSSAANSHASLNKAYNGPKRGATSFIAAVSACVARSIRLIDRLAPVNRPRRPIPLALICLVQT